jgi:choline dehydrogenase
MYHFLPIAVRYDGTGIEQGHGYQVHVGPMYSDARGRVEIKSADPMAKPSILFNYLSTDQDRREWVEAIQVTRNILAQSAFDQYSDGELSPGPEVQTPEQILGMGCQGCRDCLSPIMYCKNGYR